MFRNYFAIPTWLAVMLVGTILLTVTVLAVLGFFTAGAVLAAARQPFNPLETAAEQVAGTALPPLAQEGIVPLATLPPNMPTPPPPPPPAPSTTAAPISSSWASTAGRVNPSSRAPTP